MSEIESIIELQLAPVPPDNTSSAKANIRPIVQTALQQISREDLLSSGEILIQVEQTFPDNLNDAAVVVIITFFSNAALEVFKTVVLPSLRQRLHVKYESYTHLGKLHHNLVEYFSDEELNTLFFSLGEDYENLPGDAKEGKAREIIRYFQRRGRLSELIAECIKLRPQVSWKDAL
jgi:hypothetical protein